MEKKINHIHFIEYLKKTPNASKWEELLRRLLRGRLDYAIIKMGGVEEYIEALISGSEDHTFARIAFEEALGNLIQKWQPSINDPKKYNDYLINLIKAYTHPLGFIKISNFIKDFGYLKMKDSALTEDNYFYYLIKQYLLVLQQYFPQAPTPPDDERPAFKSYISILKKYLRDSRFRGYTAGRLIDLKINKPYDDRIIMMIKKDNFILYEIISVMFDQDIESLEEDLQRLYIKCITIGEKLEQTFIDAIIKEGASFVDGREGPKITLEGEKSVSIDLPEDLIGKYIIKYRWIRGQKRGRQVYKTSSYALEGT